MSIIILLLPVPGRWLSPNHLRQLAGWIGCPQPQLRSARTHPTLAAHLAILYGTQLLKAERHWVVSPTIMRWLQGTQREQIEPCLALLDDVPAWEQVVDKMGLETAMTLDYHHYLRQTLKRQIDADNQAQVEPAYWLPSAATTSR